MGLGHGAVLVLGDGFVELVILIHPTRLPGPDGLGRVVQLPIPGCLLNLLCLWFLVFLIILLSIDLILVIFNGLLDSLGG